MRKMVFVFVSLFIVLLLPCAGFASDQDAAVTLDEDVAGYVIRSDNSSRYVASEADLEIINEMIEEDETVSLGEILLAVCPQMLYRSENSQELFEISFLNGDNQTQNSDRKAIERNLPGLGSSTIQRYGASLRGTSTSTRPGGARAYWLLAGTRLRSSGGQVYGYVQEEASNVSSVTATTVVDPPNGSYCTEGIHYYIPSSDPGDHHYDDASYSQYISYYR
jgi:hypothetical protein